MGCGMRGLSVVKLVLNGVGVARVKGHKTSAQRDGG